MRVYLDSFETSDHQTTIFQFDRSSSGFDTETDSTFHHSLSNCSTSISFGSTVELEVEVKLVRETREKLDSMEERRSLGEKPGGFSTAEMSRVKGRCEGVGDLEAGRVGGSVGSEG